MSAILYAFPDEREPAHRLADALGVELALVETHVFPDGEILPRVGAASARTIVYRSLDSPNTKLVELLLAADALKRQGAKRIELVAPYLPYMRQDSVFRSGEPVSQQVIANLLDRAFDNIVTVDPHLHRTRSLSDIFHQASTRVLHGADALVPFLRAERFDSRTVVVGPDEESLPWIHQVSDPLGLPGLALTKRRRGDREVEILSPTGFDVSGRPVLLVDDICSTGSTLCAAARLLRSSGATSLTMFVTHALCRDEALQHLNAAGVDRVISADSCAHRTNTVALAPILAKALSGV